jgi:hypothetical protein
MNICILSANRFAYSRSRSGMYWDSFAYPGEGSFNYTEYWPFRHSWSDGVMGSASNFWAHSWTAGDNQYMRVKSSA